MTENSEAMFKNKKKYSDLANLKSLDQYTLSQVKQEITSLIFTVKKEDNAIIATWFDKYTLLMIQYSLNGEFIKILKQQIDIPKSNKHIYYIINKYKMDSKNINHIIRVLIVLILMTATCCYVFK